MRLELSPLPYTIGLLPLPCTYSLCKALQGNNNGYHDHVGWADDAMCWQIFEKCSDTWPQAGDAAHGLKSLGERHWNGRVEEGPSPPVMLNTWLWPHPCGGSRISDMILPIPTFLLLVMRNRPILLFCIRKCGFRFSQAHFWLQEYIHVNVIPYSMLSIACVQTHAWNAINCPYAIRLPKLNLQFIVSNFCKRQAGRRSFFYHSWSIIAM